MRSRTGKQGVCAEVKEDEVEGGRVPAVRANPSYKIYVVAGMFSSFQS